ncbi:MAG: type II toxin-antitoxin system RelE/ParE family toxin [Candidatus Nanoarchaeia archaeon]|nr:type II toxin-antitoxin system RelE/ParE family toxin [Candidatus Nanoarchaeia archaeon]MDD5588264.1 type II toxin-antitoxin system RelE/ParE family toxin [Candidatus Nanoarchaeia archaeon]
MKFSVDISKTAEKDLNSLDDKTCEIIINKIKSISEDPFHFLERLAGYTLYKLRCGNYRIIIRLDTNNNTMQIVMVDHREKIYKRLQRMI